jgi:mannose-6-phosphate isomerase-like protein (cupin superfamily)
MRAHLYALAFAVTGFALPACAQSAPAPAAPAANQVMNLFFDAADLPAAIAKLKAARTNNQPLVTQPRLLNMPPYRVQLEYRPGAAPAIIHDIDAEMMVVVEGTGTVVTGGKLVNETRTNAANRAGPSIEGGETREIGPGDVILVPENVAHQVIPGSGQEIVIISIHMPRPAQPGWSWP